MFSTSRGAATEDRPQESQQLSPVLTEGPTILVVDDNLIVRKGTALLLRNAGYTVVLAANGQKAIDFLRHGKRRPHVILLDMLMPVVDGWHFLEEIRHFSKPLNIPIIVTTGTILTREWALDHGCAGFLRKPFSAAELFAEINRCLANPM